jgi:alkanesulfonate monooxygenase SsuD/methylene tetrahydromethanopterin reductase-like flavin-dependent oxidoreductase (luciferase family)
VINFTLSFDMRVPAIGTQPTPPQDIYAAALDMCAYGDAAGIPYVNIMEHHGAKDGYLPAPFVMAGAIAARTKQMRIIIAALLLPLHDPVKVAEQIAVADLVSNGRLDIVFGAGYVKSEFDMFRRSLKTRGKALDEGIPIIQRALQGERFVADGREIFVTPRPVQKPYPLLYAGGGVEASARRGARLGIGFMPMNPTLVPVYLEECQRLGRKPGPIFTGLNWLHVSDTPEKTRKEIEPHLLHYCQSYADFTEGANSSSPFEGLRTIEAIEKSGLLSIVTPEQCARMALEAQKMQGRFSIAPLIGGLSPKIGWRSLELLVEKVLPLMGYDKQRQAVPSGA